MSREGFFEIEEPDIARLASARDDSPARSGWVNCGTFSVQFEVDDDGDLTVEVHPRGNESPSTVMGRFQFTREQALSKGGKDFDYEATNDTP